MSKPGKPSSDTAIDNHTYKVFPNDLNSYGTVFGGLIMAICDRIALVVAERHSESTCVTVSVDSMQFLRPAGHGDILLFSARMNRSWNSSMEIGIKVQAENYKTGDKRDIISAYFTFVAVDENKKPIDVPAIIPITEEDKRRFEEADNRKKNRKLEAEKKSKKRT